jgi:capsular polysaccharide export protein
MNQGKRSFLFLQGVASPFFEKLAHELRKKGYKTHRVHFCGGDLLYQEQTDYTNFTGKSHELEHFYQSIFDKHKVSDIFLFGDMRKVHIPAIKVARANNIKVYVYEEGYIRPNWFTMENCGVNANSLLPTDPQWYRDMAKKHGEYPDGGDTGYSLFNRAFHDIVYRLGNAFFHRKFKNYQSHRPNNGIVEYSGWAKRFSVRPLKSRLADKTIHQLLQNNTDFFVFPLQLNSDAQIQKHSPFNSIRESIQEVLSSFAKHRQKNCKLLIKIHPLDTGLINYKKYTDKVSQQLSIANHVLFIDGGDLKALLKAAKGTVLINSTTGIQALREGCPVHTLGHAIYDIPGLTHQGELSDFWATPTKPDPSLYTDFRNTLIHFTQAHGDFYSDSGIQMAVENSIQKLELVLSDQCLAKELIQLMEFVPSQVT